MKKLFFSALLTIFCYSFHAQDGYYGENLNSSLYTASQIIGNSAPQPPDAAAFQKINFIPVSNYTGRASVEVPIYIIKSGSMSVPISLSYNTSGVKVNDMASSVGLNWSLNAGGMISKMTKGMDDFYPLIYSGNSNPSGGWLSYTNGTSYAKGIGTYQDAQPDIYSVNAPGISTKYIFKDSYGKNAHGHTYAIQRLPIAVELEKKGNKIDVTEFIPHTGASKFGIKRFKNTNITATNGIKYSFGSLEESISHPIFESRYSIGGNPLFATVSNFKLDKMVDPSTNQTINFKYEKYAVNFYDEIKQSGGIYNGGSDIVFLNRGFSKVTYPTLQRLKKIFFDKGEVEFIYGLDRLDNIDEKALTEIIVRNTDRTIIKHVKLSYGYFQSSINSDTPQSKRLRLDRVYEVDINSNELPGHTFTYYDDTYPYQMPPRGSYAHDFLGYNNGSNKANITDPIPKYYLNYNNSPFNKYIRITPFADNNSNHLPIPGNFSMEANVNFAKTYSLKKIIFPRGGTNEYEYELNTFSYLGKVRQGGGIRIKSQKLDDGKGNVQIKDYEYKNGSIANFPVFGLLKGELPANGATSLSQAGIGLTTFLSPQSQVEFTQGSFVGYGTVSVKDRINNGYHKFFYSSPVKKVYKNLRPSITYDTSSPSKFESKNWSVIQSPSLFVDRDFLRGKILLEQIFTKDNTIRKEKKYRYTQKDFTTIKLEYLNKSNSNPEDRCYHSEGVYRLNSPKCGWYKEEIDLPISRDLLTSVVTKDYPVGNIVYTQGGNENISNTFKTIENYVYDEQYPLLLKETKQVRVCESEGQGNEQDCDELSDDYDHSITKTIEYPIVGRDFYSDKMSTFSYANELIAKNRISTPLKITFNGASENHIYKKFPNGLLSLEKINFMGRDGSISISDKITKRDDKARVLEYFRKDGIYVARIYGYEDRSHMVAEIVNSTHANALKTLNAFKYKIHTQSNKGTLSTDTNIRLMMNKLRIALPHTQITSYTYKKLVGITSITDPRGQTVYYHYDDFNRLEFVKDDIGNILRNNQYNYKN
jgi:hypothetical protein